MKILILCTFFLTLNANANGYLDTFFNNHNYMPIDSVSNATKGIKTKKNISSFFVSRNVQIKFGNFFSGVKNYNNNNFNEERIITFLTDKNRLVRVSFILKNNRWYPIRLLVNGKNIKNSGTLDQIFNGLDKTEDNTDFPSLVDAWNKSNDKNRVKLLKNKESIIYDLSATRNDGVYSLTYNFVYKPTGNNNGWLISGFGFKKVKSIKKGNSTLVGSRSYNLANFIDENTPYSSAGSHYSSSTNGLIVSTKSSPRIKRVTCDHKKGRRIIRLAFLLEGEESVDHHIDGYDIHRKFMNLRLNGDGMKLLKGSCKNIAVFYNNKNHMTTINLAGFGLPINGYKNGYGKTAGRSYIDFRY